MKTAAIQSLFIALAAAAAVQPKVSYDGHKVFRVPVVDDGSHVKSVLDKLNIHAWQQPSRKGAFADIQVAPKELDAFYKAMQGQQLTVMHEDLGQSIAQEGTYQSYAVGSANATWFQSYHPYADHLQWMNDLAKQYPKNAKIVTSGKSLQGNTITGVQLFGSSGGGKKPAIVFHGTVHAREWIGSMVVEFMTNELASKYGSDSDITAFVDKYDFYMFPIVNVDGFKYSQTSDRMWRKNRQSTSGSNCIGHDINRNWDYRWSGAGASNNPCAQDFRGSSAADAPETKALAGFLQTVKKNQGVKLYIDWHSYSQLFMSPYGYDCNARPANNDEYQSLLKGASEAIQSVHGTSFDYGPICSTIYQVSGGSVDYVADVVKADFSMTVELRDTGANGFVLPPEQIIPSGEEAFAGIQYLLQNMS